MSAATWPFWNNDTEVLTFFFVLVRVSGLVIFLPLLGDKTIPLSIKVLFSLAFTFIAFPVLWSQNMRLDPLVFKSAPKMIGAIILDLTFGMMVGFVANWVFQAVRFAGNYAGTTMGFAMSGGFAATGAFDADSDSDTTSFSELQYILAALLFLAINGHHIYLMTIMQSFKTVPLGNPHFFAHTEGMIQYLAQMMTEIFQLGLKLSAPVIIIIFLMNLTFGLIARAVPQMNVFVVSFAANIAIGLFIVMLSLPSFINLVHSGFDACGPELIRFLKLFGV